MNIKKRIVSILLLLFTLFSFSFNAFATVNDIPFWEHCNETGGIHLVNIKTRIKIPYVRNRPSIKQSVVEQVWNNAVANSKDGKVRDPNTNEVIEWDRSKSRLGVWDMGHIPSAKYSVKYQEYLIEAIHGDLDTAVKKFREYVNNPNNYRPEIPHNNRCNKYSIALPDGSKIPISASDKSENQKVLLYNQKTLKPVPYVHSRPTIKPTVVAKVWNNAVANSSDGKVRDPNTNEVIEWDRSKPRLGVWDVGHVPSAKYSSRYKEYLKEAIYGDLDKAVKEFREYINDAENYLPELPHNNRCHKYEFPLQYNPNISIVITSTDRSFD